MLERINEWDHSIREIPLGEFSSSAPRHRFALISWFFAVLVWIRFLFFSRHCAVTFAGADNQARFDDSHLDLAPGAIPRRVARIITKRILMAEFIGNPRKCVSQIIQCIGIVKPAAAGWPGPGDIVLPGCIHHWNWSAAHYHHPLAIGETGN